MNVKINLVEIDKKGKVIGTIVEDIKLPDEVKNPNSILVLGEDEPRNIYMTRPMTYLQKEKVINLPVVKIGETKKDSETTTPIIPVIEPTKTK